jgi:hypothetical protein
MHTRIVGDGNFCANKHFNIVKPWLYASLHLKKTYNVRVESFLSLLKADPDLEVLCQPFSALDALSQGQGPLLDLGQPVPLRLQHARTEVGQTAFNQFDL